MDNNRTPSSEILRQIELKLHAALIRQQMAFEYISEANNIKQEALSMAKASFGDRHGEVAFELACSTYGLEVDATLVSEPVSQSIKSQRASNVAPYSTIPPINNAEKIVEPRHHQSTDNSRPVEPADNPNEPKLVFFGVTIKKSKYEEASQIIEEAKSYASQKKKFNPYSGDRGRSAWRNSLFTAAFDHHYDNVVINRASDSIDPVSDIVEDHTPVESTSDSVNESMNATIDQELHEFSNNEDEFLGQTENYDDNDGDSEMAHYGDQDEPKIHADITDTFDEDIELPVSSDANDDTVATDVHSLDDLDIFASKASLSPVSQDVQQPAINSAPKAAVAENEPVRPAMPSRAVAYTPNLPKRPPSPPSNPRANPNEGYGVIKPVEGRQAAFGQASPIPDSLKEAIKSNDLIKKPTGPVVSLPPKRPFSK